MEVLSNSDNPKVRAHSSIDQYKGFFAAYERGGETPIEFDFIDFIKCVGDCGEISVVSHPVILQYGDWLGYDFPIDECEYITDDYVMHDKFGIETLPLPEEFGEGFYESYDDSLAITNDDCNSALGLRNNYRLKIGLDYYRTDEVLPSDDDM